MRERQKMSVKRERHTATDSHSLLIKREICTERKTEDECRKEKETQPQIATESHRDSHSLLILAPESHFSAFADCSPDTYKMGEACNIFCMVALESGPSFCS